MILVLLITITPLGNDRKIMEHQFLLSKGVPVDQVDAVLEKLNAEKGLEAGCPAVLSLLWFKGVAKAVATRTGSQHGQMCVRSG